MLASVDLDNQALVVAVEVENVRAIWALPSEINTESLRPQMPPEQAFRVC
jgi:hypothetical protein